MVVWLLNLVSSWVRHSGLDFDGIRSGFCLIILCKVIVSVFELWLILGSLFFCTEIRGSFLFGFAINKFYVLTIG
ncbi:hypothetical protein Peur_002803 [Populus x canadensis]